MNLNLILYTRSRNKSEPKIEFDKPSIFIIPLELKTLSKTVVGDKGDGPVFLLPNSISHIDNCIAATIQELRVLWSRKRVKYLNKLKSNTILNEISKGLPIH